MQPWTEPGTTREWRRVAVAKKKGGMNAGRSCASLKPSPVLLPIHILQTHDSPC